MSSTERSGEVNPENRSTWIVLVPTYRYIEPECESGLRELERRGVRVERRYGHSAIDRARSYLATWAYLTGFQQIMWIDSDVSFRPSDAEKLLASPEKLICGVYALKNDSGVAASNGENLAGMGFMKTHWDIYDAMRHSLPLCQQSDSPNSLMYPFFQPRWWPHLTRDKPIYYGEDYSFQLHAAELNFPLVIDRDIQLGHVGPYRYMIKDQIRHGGGKLSGGKGVV